MIIFPTFSRYFSFSHKLITIGNSLEIMHPNMHSRPQLPITGCFGFSEPSSVSVSEGRKGVNATKQKILRFLEVLFLVILLARKNSERDFNCINFVLIFKYFLLNKLENICKIFFNNFKGNNTNNFSR